MITFCCPLCKAQYRFPESRAGEKFECGKCKQRLQVPHPSAPAKPATRPASSPQFGTVVGQPIQAAPPPTPPAVVSRPLPAPSEPKVARKVKQWYYEYRFEVVGPVPERDLRVAAENGTLMPEARVWTESLGDWQPAIAVLPRVFDGLDSEPGFGLQKTVAVILATIAFASVVGLGGVYWKKTYKSTDPAKQEVVKAEPPAPVQPLPAVVPPVTPKPGPAPTPPGPTPSPPGPAPVSAPANLNAAQIFARFGPSVAFIKTDMGSGSGFLMGDGFVVTNSHVVEKSLSKNIQVAFPSSAQPEQLIPAALVYEDVGRDLAVLEVKTASLTALKLATDATPGEDVVVIGSPGTAGGEVTKNSVTRGVFSSIDEKTFGQKFFIIDASINPGNSGGPVFNSRGEVIGVVTQFIPGKQHLNYIVPYPEVERALAKKAGAGELLALAKRHDAKAVATRLMVGVLLDDTIQRRYTTVMTAARKQMKPHGPAVLAVKKEWLGTVQARTKRLAAADVLDTANRLAGTGADSADIATRDALRKLLALYNESQKLTVSPEDDSVANYIDRYQDTNKRFNGLVEAIPKSLGVSEKEFKSLVQGTFRSFGGPALSPDP